MDTLIPCCNFISPQPEKRGEVLDVPWKGSGVGLAELLSWENATGRDSYSKNVWLPAAGLGPSACPYPLLLPLDKTFWAKKKRETKGNLKAGKLWVERLGCGWAQEWGSSASSGDPTPDGETKPWWHSATIWRVFWPSLADSRGSDEVGKAATFSCPHSLSPAGPPHHRHKSVKETPTRGRATHLRIAFKIHIHLQVSQTNPESALV